MSYAAKKSQRLLTALSKELSAVRVGGQLCWSARLDLGTPDSNDEQLGWDHPNVTLLPASEESHPLVMGRLDVPNKQATLRTWTYQHQALHLRFKNRSMPLAEGDYEQAYEKVRALLSQFGFRVIALSADALPRHPVKPIVRQKKKRKLSKYVSLVVSIVAIVIIVRIFMYALQVLEKSSGL